VEIVNLLLIIVPKLRADLATLETLEVWRALVFRPPVSQRWLVKVRKEYFQNNNLALYYACVLMSEWEC